MDIAADDAHGGQHRSRQKCTQNTGQAKAYHHATHDNHRVQIDAIANDARHNQPVFKLLDQKISAHDHQRKAQIANIGQRRVAAPLDERHNDGWNHGQRGSQIGHNF